MKKVLFCLLFVVSTVFAQTTEEPIVITKEVADKIKLFIESQNYFLEQQQEQIIILQQQIKELKKKQCTNS